MDRRKFICVTGGGFVVAAATASAGCTQHMPAAAIEPWKGPGQEADVRRWMLGYAILAPHSHNLQSWLVDLRTPDEIVLRCDLARLLPETDPFSRQIMMSHGTFLELLDIAARERGLKAEISPVSGGPVRSFKARPAAGRARPSGGRSHGVEGPVVRADPRNRRTNRSMYEPDAPGAGRSVAGDVGEREAEFHCVSASSVLDQPDALRRHRVIAAEAWRIEADNAAGDHGVVQGAARRRCGDRTTPRWFVRARLECPC